MTCLYHDKRSLQFSEDSIRWMLSDGQVCSECRQMIRARYGAMEPKKTVALQKEVKMYQKPEREAGSDDE